MARIGQHLHLAPYKREKFQTFLHGTEYNDWTWNVVYSCEDRQLAYDTEAQMIRDATSLGPVLNVVGNHKNTKITWLSDHQYTKNTKPWNAGKTGVYKPESLEKMRVAKLRKSSVKEVYTSDDRQRARDSQQCKAVMCVETGVVYQSISVAAQAIGTCRSGVRNVLKGKLKYTKGYSFVYVDQTTEQVKKVI